MAHKAHDQQVKLALSNKGDNAFDLVAWPNATFKFHASERRAGFAQAYQLPEVGVFGFLGLGGFQHRLSVMGQVFFYADHVQFRVKG